MSKLLVLLVVYAAAVSSWLLWQHGAAQGRTTTTAARDTFLDPDNSSDQEVRRLMAEARSLMAAEAEAKVESVDWQLSRIEELRASMEEGLEAAQQTATEAGRATYGKLAALQAELKKLTGMTEALRGLRSDLAGLSERVKALEERPAQVIREVVRGRAAPTQPVPAEPKRPTLPQAARKDPEVVREEVARARQDIKSSELSVIFKAIHKLQEHRVLAEVPRLIEILSKFPEEMGRMAAAAALGKMKAADALPALAEALLDKAVMVSQQANLSIRQITGFDTQLSPSARLRERRTVRNRVKEWWRSNEAEVRERLGQPAAAPPKDD